MASAVRGYVSGRVQGVYFRRHVQEAAQALGLTGYARNLDDGRVEVVLCGDPQAVEAARSAVAAGPPRSRVDGIEWQEIEPPGDGGFQVL